MTDHGPQRQPASEVCECCESTHDVRDANGNMLCAMCRGSEYDELARLRAENERYVRVLRLIADQDNWDTIYADVSWNKTEKFTVWGGSSHPELLAADALRGEIK